MVSIRAMKRILAILGLLIFVLAMLVLPAAHTHGACGEHACSRTVEHDASDHNDDDGEKHPDQNPGHDQDSCPICQLSQTPVDTATPVDLGHGRTLAGECVALPQLPVAATVARRANGSRAPPFSA